MIYTLTRLRAERPSPPFVLGGRYHAGGNAHYLADAFETRVLRGPPLLFHGVSDGDLVVVGVDATDVDTLQISKLRVEVKSEARAAPKPAHHAERFARFQNDVQAFLLARGLKECLTPHLVVCPGLEPTIDAFETTLTRGRERRTVYLPTSPEVHLKKAIAEGWHDVFEIKTCFRRDEFSDHHENEFRMLEWYRGFADLNHIIADLHALLGDLAGRGWFENPALTITDFETLFDEEFNFKLTPQTNLVELTDLARKLGLDLAADDTFNDVFNRLMVDRLEPAMATRGALVVRRFPPSQAALANFDGRGWADRFEFYWNGLEIANAFNEVNDPGEQRERWAIERRERARLGRAPLPEDPELITALQRGFPPTGGIALGLERLYMAGQGVKTIRELRLFSGTSLI